jgi:hypothetical protein
LKRRLEGVKQFYCLTNFIEKEVLFSLTKPVIIYVPADMLAMLILVEELPIFFCKTCFPRRFTIVTEVRV